MKLDSKYFDRIRVKPEDDRLARDRTPDCEWPGCEKKGTHPAPKGREREGEYHYFCMDHVRQYNKGYNYFNGMKDDELSDWRKRDEVGHRPTWKLGKNSYAELNGGRFRKAGKKGPAGPADDPFGFFGGQAGGEQHGRPRRAIRNAELKALHELGLDETATPDQVKSQYKTLVKRLHPDANGGSRSNEDKLREIIRAYDYLRNSGFC